MKGTCIDLWIKTHPYRVLSHTPLQNWQHNLPSWIGAYEHATNCVRYNIIYTSCYRSDTWPHVHICVYIHIYTYSIIHMPVPALELLSQQLLPWQRPWTMHFTMDALSRLGSISSCYKHEYTVFQFVRQLWQFLAWALLSTSFSRHSLDRWRIRCL